MTNELEQAIIQHEEDLKTVAEMRLLDDDFMTKVFEGSPDETELILTIILGFKVQVIDVRVQYVIKNLVGRSARLDIYAKDEFGRIFNVEIQRADKGADAKRARFNSSLIDANLLPAGTKGYPLPETYVIFITEKDVLKEGYGVYHINRIVEETGKPFNDGEHILYVNGQLNNDTELGWLMHDFRCKTASDMHYEKLAKRVRFYKETEEGVNIMCKMLEDMRNEVAERVSADTIKGIAKNLIMNTELSDDAIAQNVNLSVMEISSLRKSLLQPV